MNPLICATLALFGTSALLPAATYFTENFDGGVMNSGQLALGVGFGSPVTTFAGDNFAITSGTNSRIYLGTVGTDYSLVDFTFQATVTVPNTTNAWAIPFIGMGSSAATGGSGEPNGTNNLLMAVRNDVARLESRDNGVIATAVSPVAGIPNGTHLLRMTWNAATKNAFFEFDGGNDGLAIQSFNFSGADNGFTGGNSQLVLGGGNGLIFDNISVTVPEPGAALLGGLGLLGLLRRRR